MSNPALGALAPDFTLAASNGQQFTLSQYRGKKVVLFFYPEDLTPSCTNEACDFRDLNRKFRELGVVVLGISPDPMKKHDKFIAEYKLPYLLLSDPDHQVEDLYGVWGLKKMYGREYMGTIRSTFLIDEQGRLAREWRGIRVKGHAEAVLAAAREL